jgi:hypothetical protein
LQQFRYLRAPEFVGAIAKDFAHGAFCYYLIVFRRSLRWFLPPSFRDVLGFSTVGLAIPNWMSGPVQLRRFQLSFGKSIRSFSHSIASRTRLDRRRNGKRFRPRLRGWPPAYGGKGKDLLVNKTQQNNAILNKIGTEKTASLSSCGDGSQRKLATS